MKNAIVATIFVGLISLPLGANLAGRDGADPQMENRTLASFPRLDGSWRSISGFGGGLSDWFSDHFGFRSTFIRWYGETRLFGLGVSPTAGVVKGSDGWFFYADDESLTDYANTRPLTDREVERWTAAAVDARDWLRAQGIAYVAFFAPDKHVIYPEVMPPAIRPVRDESRLDQVIEAYREAGVTTVDVRAALLAAKGSERLYQKTDTHWNDRGAFIAYQQLMDAVRNLLPAVPPPLNRDDFELTTIEREGMDLAGMMGLTRALRETDLQLTPKRLRRAVAIQPAGMPLDLEIGRIVAATDDSTLPRAVIFRDSFFSRLAPFVAEHFSRTAMIWQNDFDPEVVLEEKPAVVIQEIVGRHLYTFLPTPELVPK